MACRLEWDRMPIDSTSDVTAHASLLIEFLS